MGIQQQIINYLQTLHPHQLKEVLDFVIFVHEKQDADFTHLRGKYRNDLSSSEIFAQRKHEEIEIENQ
jgi:hypothetical protein